MRENLSVRKIFERSVYECVRNKIIESTLVCSFTLSSSPEYSFILVLFFYNIDRVSFCLHPDLFL